MSGELAKRAILLLAPQPFFQNRGTPIAVRLLADAMRRTARHCAAPSS